MSYDVLYKDVLKSQMQEIPQACNPLMACNINLGMLTKTTPKFTCVGYTIKYVTTFQSLAKNRSNPDMPAMWFENILQ